MLDFKMPSDAEIVALCAEIHSGGLACYENFLSAESVHELQGYVTSATSKEDTAYFVYAGADRLLGSPLGELAASTKFKDLLKKILTLGGYGNIDQEDGYTLLRCVQGESGAQFAYRFHFDAYAVTALLPIFIPSDRKRDGGLIIIPNIRGMRRSGLMNLIEKAIYQGSIFRILAKHFYDRTWFKASKPTLIPGNLYFFWGYRSLHGNDICDADALRATAIFHLGEPHKRDPLIQFIETRRLNRQRTKGH